MCILLRPNSCTRLSHMDSKCSQDTDVQLCNCAIKATTGLASIHPSTCTTLQDLRLIKDWSAMISVEFHSCKRVLVNYPDDWFLLLSDRFVWLLPSKMMIPIASFGFVIKQTSCNQGCSHAVIPVAVELSTSVSCWNLTVLVDCYKAAIAILHSVLAPNARRYGILVGCSAIQSSTRLAVYTALICWDGTILAGVSVVWWGAKCTTCRSALVEFYICKSYIFRSCPKSCCRRIQYEGMPCLEILFIRSESTWFSRSMQRNLHQLLACHASRQLIMSCPFTRNHAATLHGSQNLQCALCKQ